MKMRSLPLGIDMGTARLRVVHSTAHGNERRLRAIATRDISQGAVTAEGIIEPEYVTALVEDAVRELETFERRCVGAIGLPAAKLRPLAFPGMTALERIRTARFEAARCIEYPVSEAVVRLRRLNENSRHWALGIVRAKTLRSRVACLRKAGLRVKAMEDEGCALRRSLCDYDAVLDVAEFRSTLYLTKALAAFQVHAGGAAITTSIEEDLNLDRPAAEKRKRILGTAGAGERAKTELVISLASLIDEAQKVAECRSIALIGNGARLPGLVRDLTVASGVKFEFAVSHSLDGAYAADVLSLGAPDWTLAAALSCRPC